MSLARVALAGLLRAPGRTLTRVVVLAAAVALLGSMLLFIGHSLRTMTASATRSVPLHWQGPVGSYDQARRVADGVARERGILQASASATAPFAGATHSGSAGATVAGGGSVLAVPPDYLRHIRTFHLLQGSLQPAAIVLDQQLAATLRARIGERVVLRPRATAPARAYTVSGVASVTAPDVLFAPLNPQVGPAPAQPPANVAIMPLDTFASSYAPALPAIQTASPGASAVPGAQQGVQWQVQAQLKTRGLGHSPAQALTRAGHVRNRVERSFPGQVQFV
ncbi:MAG: hypothetical protein QOD76_283, partial [Solirubrobacteraceae bacterium]|nr:hypothetical protein [Solirubrobacteraceae bacterium]